ncbi:PIN domain-containing protein [Mangrovicoccus ximenensis]|uniref:PIN domain-containing protein n=1 Tax=Mangrovicoccus ximenensis TaxID=1911570 RepID=UPI000D3CB4D2|nr:PIN domain-containing protein [Mangrovicoccus ximenensis]
MPGRFLDTNVILCLLDDGPKAERAEAVLAGGGTISVQVLNKALVNCLRKARMTRDEADEFLHGICRVCRVLPLTAEVHDIGRALGARYGFAVCESIIVAAALADGCDTLLSEDMQDGLLVEGRLRISNPFA